MSLFKHIIIYFLLALISGCRGCHSSKPESENKGEITPAPTQSSSLATSFCICTCRSDEIEGNLCNHFTKEPSGDGFEFVCDDDYLVKITSGACETYPSDMPENATCSGHHPETKAGGVKGRLANCSPK